LDAGPNALSVVGVVVGNGDVCDAVEVTLETAIGRGGIDEQDVLAAQKVRRSPAGERAGGYLDRNAFDPHDR
ncbi:MAG: hypothetical protein ACI9TI_000664, partial [Natronomonas sp.]